MSSSPPLIFEDLIDARLYAFLRGVDAEVHAIADWLPRAFPDFAPVLEALPARQREFFQQLVPDAPHAAFARGALRRTLEELRWADAVTDDDLGLAFAALPETPAYASLAAAAAAYAEVFVDGDVPALARHLPPFDGAAPRFVASVGSTVFRNLATAVGAECVDAWTLADGPRTRAPLRIDGPAAVTLPRIVDAVRRRVQRGRRVLVLVAGAASERLWLESALAAVAPVRTLDAAIEAPSNVGGNAEWRALRTFRDLSMADRLRWSRRFDRLERDGTADVPATILAEMRRDGVPETIASALEAHWKAATSPVDAGSPVDAPIALATLRPVGTAEGADVLVIASEGTSESAPPTLLTPSDRGRLKASGFAVAERPTTMTTLECLSRPTGKRRVFFALGGNVGPVPSRVRLATPEPKVRDALWTLDGLDDRAPRASATQLSTFAECPAKYVARYRWRWNPPEPPENEFHRWVGTLAHALLEHWHRQHPDVSDLGGPAELRALFDAARATAFRPDDGPPPALEVAVRRRSLALAARGLALEPALAGRFGVKRTLGVELGFEWRSGTRAFGGRYDRVVETTNGTVIVLDYKTGATAFSPAHATTGDDPQGALYWLSGVERFGERFGGVLFVSLKESTAERGVLRKSLVGSPPTVRGHVLDDTKWNDGLVAARAAIESRAEALWRETRFAPTPSAEACERCGYGVLCRERWGDV